MAGSRRERKVVTVVFCDLVGFTARAESMDPEDVEAILGPYHQRVRTELERHGGTVEKFIGDAVMALFGAPVAHEDDPERAVRASLAIRDFAVEEGLELRVGITTGEALIRLDARPDAGEGMASGDGVNTAARLQSAAPVNGVLVDETTYRATRNPIEYEPAEPVEAKGKARPITVWRAREARARFGVDVAHEARTELVGRERELDVLRDAFARVRHERVPQLVTLVGVPGMGKSRLVYELSRIADADPELVTWRQGRCLAYGDGVTLWALSEIVKAQAGVAEQDAPEAVAEKLRRAVVDVLGGSGDEHRVEAQLLALVGLAEEAELGGDRRGPAFAAWRRFLEGLAEQFPFVLVFEDLHWADETLLDFVDELVDWVTEVPLLVVGTARPEFLERRPGWGGGKLNATTLALAPLSEEQTARLLGRLLDRPILSADSQRALLERAGGNPLYAEQVAELYLEQGRAEELPVPETLQGIIAARLDALPEAEKELLKDASVIGKVFWASGLAGDGFDDVVGALHALERKGFVRRQKRSSVEGETELAFTHALVRDVAYGQIARADRARRHRRVAEWIEALGRPDDHAEMLAHHWRAALELFRAARQEDPGLDERARAALRNAGDRAFGLNAFPAAARYYGHALELSPPDHAGRHDLLFRWARSLHNGGDPQRQDALAEARDALLEAGDLERAAESESFLSQAAGYGGRRAASDAHLARAVELVADRGPSASKARVLAFSARLRMLAGEREQAEKTAHEALALAEQLSLDELRAHALATIGSSTAATDRDRSTGILEQALAIAQEANSPLVAPILGNLAVVSWMAGELRRADELYLEAQRMGERLGDLDGAGFARGNRISAAYVLGRWDEALAAADEFIAQCETRPNYQEGGVRVARAAIRLACGDTGGAIDDFSRALTLGREAKDPQALLPALLQNARAHGLLGNLQRARELAREGLELVRAHPQMAPSLGILASTALVLGLRDELVALVAAAPARRWGDAALSALRGDYARAAELLAEMGVTWLEAELHLVAAGELVESGRRDEAEVELEQALAFYRSVGATFFVERGERLLAEAKTA